MNVQMPQALHDKAKNKAKSQYVSLSAVVRQLLAQWLQEGNVQDASKPIQNSDTSKGE